MEKDAVTSRRPAGRSPAASAWLRRWMFRSGIDPFTYLVRLAVIAILAVCFVTPMLWMVTAMTKTNQQLLELPPLAIGSIAYIGVAWQHLMAFINGVLLNWIYNSIYYVLLGLALSISVAVPAGFALAVIRFRGRRLLLWVTLLTMLVPADALVLPMYLELFYLRMINTPWALIVPAASFPMGVYLTFQYFKAHLPRDIVAAARIDGCSDWQLFRHIGLPLARNIIGVLAFTNFATLWSNFFAANLFIDSAKYKTLPAGISLIVSQCGAVLPMPARCIAIDGVLTPMGRAEVALLGFISTFPVLVIYLLAQRMIIRGATAGAIRE
jgi:multiple sugar transport system permease protein